MFRVPILPASCRLYAIWKGILCAAELRKCGRSTFPGLRLTSGTCATGCCDSNLGLFLSGRLAHAFGARDDACSVGRQLGIAALHLLPYRTELPPTN